MSNGIILGGLDVVGDDELEGDDDDIDGEYMVGRAAVARHRGRRKVKVPVPSWMRNANSQGVSVPQQDMDFLPFTPAVIAAGALTGVLPSFPQRPMRPERLVMDAISNALSAVPNVVIDPAIFVGAVQIGATQGSTPISVFAANAFGVRLSMPAVGQGTRIEILVRLLAAAANPTTVTATMIGRAMR